MKKSNRMADIRKWSSALSNPAKVPLPAGVGESYRVDVFVEDEWVSNALRFSTKDEANAYSRDLWGRWMAVKQTKITKTQDAVTHSFHDGVLSPVKEGINPPEDDDDGRAGGEQPPVYCPACGNDVSVYLGRLGQREHYRCRGCGMEYSRLLFGSTARQESIPGTFWVKSKQFPTLESYKRAQVLEAAKRSGRVEVHRVSEWAMAHPKEKKEDEENPPRWYVGFTPQRTREVFQRGSTPTHTSHGERYSFVSGPFSSERMATLYAEGGHLSPITGTIAQWEARMKRSASSNPRTVPTRDELQKKAYLAAHLPGGIYLFLVVFDVIKGRVHRYHWVEDDGDPVEGLRPMHLLSDARTNLLTLYPKAEIFDNPGRKESRECKLDSWLYPLANEENPPNLCAKMRKPDNPYEIWKSRDGSWTWFVLKKWQSDDDKPYARWFCLVKTPIVPEGEMGDVYVKDIKGAAVRVDVGGREVTRFGEGGEGMGKENPPAGDAEAALKREYLKRGEKGYKAGWDE